jgi:cytochrome b subunit of formate dehydrogenase
MDKLERFSPVERSLHWMTALATFFLLITGVLIWKHLDEWEIRGINVISQGHVWLGGLPLIIGFLTYALRKKQPIPHAEKRFSLGQRLGLMLTRAAMVVVVPTGMLVYLREFLAISKPVGKLIKRVHFWSASAIAAFVLVHLVMVLLSPKGRGLLQGMRTGWIARSVAQRVSPDWVASLETDGEKESEAKAPDAPSPTSA